MRDVGGGPVANPMGEIGADPLDPLEGQEVKLLNAMLPKLVEKANGGDEAAVDRVLKILELKLKYRQERQAAVARWRL